MKTIAKLLSFLALCIIAAPRAHASLVNGPADTLNATEADQIESWLDQGTVSFTRIFSKAVDGPSAAAFHASSNFQGPTVTVLTLDNGQKIGGYNPISWTDSAGSFQTSGALDAFMFNLTSLTLYEQHGDLYGPGNQTFNRPDFGPTFGGGNDLYVNQTLTGGSANIGFTYGDSSRRGQTDYRNEFAGSFDAWTIEDLEVFTVTSIPEPSAALAWGAVALAMAWKRTRGF